MASISIPAHFDGQQILLDEPCELEPNARLIVTVLPNHDSERESWLKLSTERLPQAYGDDEAEYSLDLIRDPNPDYEGRKVTLPSHRSRKLTAVLRTARQFF